MVAVSWEGAPPDLVDPLDSVSLERTEAKTSANLTLLTNKS